MDLLLLHGALGSAQQMRPLQERIGGLAIDLSGHGGRQIPAEGITFEQFLHDIDAVFTEHGWSKAGLIGYSMGGYAALLYAAKHPERVDHVVTVGTKLIWTAETLQKELRKLDPDVMLAKVPAFVESLVRVHGKDRWRQVVTAIVESMSELAARPLLTEEVCARIQCPVLLCVGDSDTTAIVEDTDQFAAGLRDAKVGVLPDTGHPFEEVDLDLLIALMNG